MNKNSLWKTYILLMLLFLIALFLYKNIKTPYGDHLLVSIGMTPSPTWKKIYLNKITSQIYLKNINIECQFKTGIKTAIFDEDDAIYNSIPAMFVLYDFYEETIDEKAENFFTDITHKIISSCDKNALLHKNAPPPIIYAILSGRLDFVERMIDEGADFRFKINKPGKASNNMTPLDFSRDLKNNPKFSERKNKYSEIENLLEKRLCCTNQGS